MTLAAAPHSILVVDDEPDDREFVTLALSAHGIDCEIMPCASAADALAIVDASARQPTPDLVFLDLRLPDAPGMEVLLHMRRVPALREVPVIVLSSELDAEQIRQCRRLGARCYQKMASFNALVELVGRVLNELGMTRAESA